MSEELATHSLREQVQPRRETAHACMRCVLCSLEGEHSGSQAGREPSPPSPTTEKVKNSHPLHFAIS